MASANSRSFVRSIETGKGGKLYPILLVSNMLHNSPHSARQGHTSGLALYKLPEQSEYLRQRNFFHQVGKSLVELLLNLRYFYRPLYQYRSSCQGSAWL